MIFAIFHQFTLLLSRHQKGIYITLIFHLVILIILVSFKINASHQQKNTQILFDFSTIEPDPTQLTEEEKTALRQQIEQSIKKIDIQNTHTDVNANEKLLDKLDKNVDVYRQAAETQQRLQETYQQKSEIPQETTSKSEATALTPLPSSQKPTGNVAVKYDIPNRKATKLPMPIYQCQTDGEVVVAVEVNANGYVVRAGVIRQQSTADECLQEAALKSARLSRFTIQESKTDKGTISYLFAAQTK